MDRGRQLFVLGCNGAPFALKVLTKSKIKLMNKISASLMIAIALTFSARAADASAKISGVHLCCDSCVKGVQKAVAGVGGVTAVVDKDDEMVSLTASDNVTLQKAADALVAAGYFGKSSDGNIKLDAATGAKDQKVTSLKISGVHLCCGKCVKAVGSALASVDGVTGNTAAKGAKSFEVTGDFNDKEVLDALQKAGLTGKVE
jgi:copper chaperone CopZ